MKYTDYIKTPKWADRKSSITKIDQHIFYTKTLLAEEPKRIKRTRRLARV